MHPSIPGSQVIPRNKNLRGMYSLWRYRIGLDPGIYIGLPLAQSVIAMLLFTQFAALWNGFFAAYLFLENDQLKTLPVGLQVIASMTGALNPNPSAQGKVLLLRPDMATAGVITVLPVILVFLISQRMIVKAATAGAIQGE